MVGLFLLEQKRELKNEKPFLKMEESERFADLKEKAEKR